MNLGNDEDLRPSERSNTTQSTTSPLRRERYVSVEDTKPEDIRELTIRNLDTGEEFIIGENDPDFEFDTFPLTATLEDGHPKKKKKPWYKALFSWFLSKPNPTPSRHTTVEEEQYTKLSSFKFRKELGRGAFGRVLLAESKTTGELYAIKIMSKKNMRMVDKQQALAERDILHAMAHTCPHPFTTGLKFAFQSENNLYIGMEYLNGGNLKQLIQRFGSLPEDWVRVYAAELILAVSHLHSMQVLYRDIKPHNVMIDSSGHLILIDYGLSKQEVSQPTGGAMSLVGTPDYSAPEVLRTAVFRLENEDRMKKGKSPKKPSAEKGEDGYGMAADWWSVGVMIYEMLCGYPTFRGADLRQTYQKVLYGDILFTAEEKFSPTAKELILGFLNREPRDRLGSRADSPRDIQSSSFFHSINWDDVFHRTKPGPWIPPPHSAKKSQAPSEGKTTLDSESEGGELLGFSGRHTYSETTSEISEALTMQDSIIGDSKNDPNRLPHWSFMDENSLRSFSTNTVRVLR